MQIILTLGIVVAQAINLGTQHIPGYGWRISLACAGIPALVLTAGGLLLPDTPNSLIDRGHEEQGKQVGRPSDKRSGLLAPREGAAGCHATVSGEAGGTPLKHECGVYVLWPGLPQRQSRA